MSGDQLPVEMPKAKRASPGPVYQGVCATIRRLQELGVLEAPGKGEDGRQDGTIAQARSLAASIDRESGHTPGTRQASGVSLAALHERLDALLARLDPNEEGGGSDEFQDMLTEMRALPGVQAPPVDVVDRPGASA